MTSSSQLCSGFIFSHYMDKSQNLSNRMKFLLNEESGDECESECSSDILDVHNKMSGNEISFSVFIDSETATTNIN